MLQVRNDAIPIVGFTWVLAYRSGRLGFGPERRQWPGQCAWSLRSGQEYSTSGDGVQRANRRMEGSTSDAKRVPRCSSADAIGLREGASGRSRSSYSHP